MANIRDIAKQANVSTATVSRVFNNHQSVSDSTRQLVWQAAQALNYPLEKLKASPPLSRSVLVLSRDEDGSDADSSLSREFERTVWVGVQSVFEEENISTRLQRSKMRPEEAVQYADDVAIAGLVLLGGVVNHDFVEQLKKQELPFVIVGAYVPSLKVNCVMADVMDGIRQIIRHLVALGRKKMAFVNGPPTTATSQAKLDGLRLEFGIQNLSFSPDQVVAADFTPEAGYLQTQRLLKQSRDLDAIIYADDVIAIGGLKALREANRQVPRDVAVVGFGDYELGQYATPALTSVTYDMHAMGEIAARRLCMLLNEPDAHHWVVIRPTTLVPRESTLSHS
jgi:DNA-binding LacI/PurR family transcriptional regulator